MKRILIFFALFAGPSSQSPAKKPVGKILPEFKGVHPELQPYYDEWLALAAKQDVKFRNKVSMGFKQIDAPTIGRCWNLFLSREIEIDSTYWLNASPISRRAVLYHELVHCFCGRDHDYGKNKMYPKNKLEPREKMVCDASGDEKPGYFDDGCPTTIMHPTIIDDSCYVGHYDHYVVEMFDRCKPW